MEGGLVRRCTGHCCRGFVLGGLTLKDIKENHRRSRISGEMEGIWPQKLEDGRYLHGPIDEIGVIVDMLFEVDKVDAAEPMSWVDRRHNAQRFSCRHLKGDRCAIYDRRPHLCRAYPNGRACEYRHCTREI
jgi:Fe-S-cluster containining protein